MSLKKVNEKEVVEEDIVDTDEDTATKRLNNAVKVAKAIFHLNDEYVVTSFKDGGKTIALTDGFLVPAPSVTPETSSTFYGLRLV